MIFNGISKDYLLIKSKGRPFFTPLNRNYMDKAYSDLRTDKGVTVLPVYVHIEFDNFTDFERKKEDMAQWLIHDEPKILSFSDDPERIFWAAVDGSIDYDNAYPTAADAVIKFICGYKYSTEKQITATGTKNISGHLPTIWRTKTTFTANQTGYELQFNLPGKTALRDICKIKLNGNFISGDVLEILYSKRKILLNNNDITNQLVILQSNFKELDIGQVIFTSSHETTFYYHERYY